MGIDGLLPYFGKCKADRFAGYRMYMFLGTDFGLVCIFLRRMEIFFLKKVDRHDRALGWLNVSGEIGALLSMSGFNE